MYLDRLNQLDLRLSKTFTLGRIAVQGNVDMYNALNSSPVVTVNQAYGSNGAAWLVPTQILLGRLVKFGARLEF